MNPRVKEARKLLEKEKGRLEREVDQVDRALAALNRKKPGRKPTGQTPSGTAG